MLWKTGGQMLALAVAVMAFYFGVKKSDRVNVNTLNGLAEWISLQGGEIKVDLVTLVEQGDAGRGVLVKSPIEKGTVVARMPFATLVNVEHAVVEFTKKFPDLEAEVDDLSDLDLMGAFVLYEHSKGEYSKWMSLWKSFPANVSESSIFFCEKQLAVIEETLPEMAQNIRNIQMLLRDRYESSKLLKHSSIAPTLSKFLTAITLVQSRLFSVPIKDRNDKWQTSKCLVPFADLLNTCETKSQNADCRTNGASTHFECFTTRAVEAGDFLCVPYTDTDSNSLLFLNYGFTLEPSAAHPNLEKELLIRKLAARVGEVRC